MIVKRTVLLGCIIGLAACGDGSAGLDQTGPRPDLPEVNQRLLPAMNIATPAGWNGEMPSVPDGFTITALATDLQIPRQILVLPNGDILVAEGTGGNAPKVRPKDVIARVIKAQGKTSVESGNRITLLRDADRDGTPEVRTVFIDGLNAPYGLAFVDGSIYVANQDALLEFPYAEGQTQITAAPREVTKLPSEINHHWTKALAISPDGQMLYVGIGSNSNAAERGMMAEQDRAVIWEIDRETGAHRNYATGIRNPTALAFHPETGALWAAVNERDEIGPELPPDYITSVRDGGFYGWPYSYWGSNVDPRVRPQRPELVRTAITPDYAVGSHVAPLGITIASGAGLGAGYANGAFVGMHGSWNRNQLAGYKVVWIPFSDGRPSGEPRDFVTDFLDGEGHARGRPVGVTLDPIGGALLVADDLSNTIWRIAPTVRADSPAADSASG